LLATNFKPAVQKPV